MREVNLAFIGYGNVAQGLPRILQPQQAAYEKAFGLRFLITAITDPSKGTAFDPDGLNPTNLLDAVEKTGTLEQLPCAHPNWDAMEMIQNSPADVVLELSHTNLETGEPATTYIAEALRRKKHVVTTNKGPIALNYDMLASLARLHGVEIGVEGTVMSGTPCLFLGRRLLAGAEICKIQGILNGTTNYILTRMEEGLDYADALAEAQARGYAEADPTGDVEGYDAAAKVAILARLVLGTTLPFGSIQRQGIAGLTRADITAALAAGEHWKLLGTVEEVDGQLVAQVRPERLPESHPLARVSGANNALVYTTSYLGDVTLVGPGAGPMPTGYAVIQDLFTIFRE
jgi:homoserine dehydrogenase